MPLRRASIDRLPGSCFVAGMAEIDNAGLGALGLIHALRRLGLRVAAMAPLVADGVHQSGRWTSPHLERLGRAASFGLPGSILSPYVLPSALTPSLAIREAHTQVDAQSVVETYQVLATWADAVVVEGVGGLQEPLGPTLSVHEIAGLLGLPMVLTLAAEAGALERAAVAMGLARASGVRVAGWIATGTSLAGEPMVPLLAQRLGCAPLGVIPAHARESAEAGAGLNLQALRRALDVRTHAADRHAQP